MNLADRLRHSLSGPPPSNVLSGDLADDFENETRAAAVLVAVTRRVEPGIILTVRREHLRHHAGQIAFPGGRIDDGDANAAEAAIREAHEEIGLPRDQISVWGLADTYRTVTGFDVTPVIGEVAPDLSLVPQESEVAECFEAPLEFLLDPTNHRLMEIDFRGARRTYYEIQWRDRRIWGATAAMIVNLSRRMAA